MSRGHSPSSGHGFVYLGLAATLLVASGGLIAGYFLLASEAAVASTARARGQAVGPDAVKQAVGELLESNVAVQIGDRTVELAWSELGVALDAGEMSRAAAMAEESDIIGSLRAIGALPMAVQRENATDKLGALKARYDSMPRDALMDLENRTIQRSQEGLGIDVLSSLAAIEAAARSGAERLELRTVPIPPRITVEDLGIDDISHVLARFETRFSVAERSRNYNLKLAASKLNGHVLQPGVEFSFNDVVGARTENEGYKIAGVITAGEMVDGLAGGTCQISTTLHGAAFFAGLDILKAVPHSRPSTYVTMGLDATVVYPQVDLKMKNPYDFPVVIHYKVTRGRSIVEILGREKPYDKVMFERRMTEKIEFDTITREDDGMPVGSMKVDQYGFYGYKVDRVRKMYKGGKVAKRDRWRIRYAPVTEYARMGINPDPNLVPKEPKKKKKKKKRLKEPKMRTFRMVQ